MIYDLQVLKSKFKDYANINQKVSLEAKKDSLYRIKRGLYSDNIDIDGPIIANVCCNPSYLSFEYALSRYGLIPEYVSCYTSACFSKKNNKWYVTSRASFEYRCIPQEAFPYGIVYFQNEEGIKYKIACKEKALCDILYSKYPVRSIKDLKTLLFEDLRIDEDELHKLDFDFIQEVAPKYRCNTLYTFCKYLKEIK